MLNVKWQAFCERPINAWKLNIVSFCCLHDTISPRLLVHYIALFEEIPTTTKQSNRCLLYILIKLALQWFFSFLLQSSPCSRFVNFSNWHLKFLISYSTPPAGNSKAFILLTSSQSHTWKYYFNILIYFLCDKNLQKVMNNFLNIIYHTL